MGVGGAGGGLGGGGGERKSMLSLFNNRQRVNHFAMTRVTCVSR